MTAQATHRLALPIAALSLVLGAIFAYLFFDYEIGVNFPVFVLIAIAAGLALVRYHKQTLSKQDVVLCGLALLFSLMVLVRASDLLSLLNAAASLALLLLLAATHARKSFARFVPEEYVRIFWVVPVEFVGHFFGVLADSWGSVAKNNSPHKREVIRGTILGLIAVVVFSLLFASADAAFERLLTGLIPFSLDGSYFGRIILALAVGAFFTGAFGYIFSPAGEEGAARERLRTFGMLEMRILLGSICALFLVFILVQAAYLFGGESHLLSEGLTYADYARRGFYELMFVALCSYAIISAIEKRVVKQGEAHQHAFKLLSSILVAEVIVILFSSFMRLSLYEQAYGFSVIRLYSHALILWVGCMLVLLEHHILRGTARANFALSSFVLAVAALLLINILNPDAFIAQKNIERYEQTGKLDAQYLASLSADAAPQFLSILNGPSSALKDEFAAALSGTPHSSTEYVPWQSYRLPNAAERDSLSQYRQYIEENRKQPQAFLETI